MKVTTNETQNPETVTRPFKALTVNIGQRTQSCTEKIIMLIERHHPHVLILTETHEVGDLPTDLQPAYPELRFDAFRQYGYVTHKHGPSFETLQLRANNAAAKRNYTTAANSEQQIHTAHRRETKADRRANIGRHANAGVTLLIRADIPHEILTKDTQGYEITFELRLTNQKTVVIQAIYGRQNSDQEKKRQWKTIYEKTRHQLGSVDIIAGDFNSVMDPMIDCRQICGQVVLQRAYQRLRHPAEIYFQKLGSLHGGEYTDAWRHANGPNTLEFTCLTTIKKATGDEPDTYSESRIDGFLVLNRHKHLITSCVHGEADERFTDHIPVLLETDIIKIPVHDRHDRHYTHPPSEPKSHTRETLKRTVINNERLRCDTEIRGKYLQQLQKQPTDSTSPQAVLNDPTEALAQLNEAMYDALDECNLRSAQEPAQHAQQRLYRHRDRDEVLQILRTNHHRNLRSRAALLQYLESPAGTPLPKIIKIIVKHNLPEWKPTIEILSKSPTPVDVQEWFRQMSKLTRKLGKAIKQRERTLDTLFFRERCDKILNMEHTDPRKWFRQYANPEKRIQLSQRHKLYTVSTSEGERSSEPETVRKTVHRYYQEITKKQDCEANRQSDLSRAGAHRRLPGHLEQYARRPVFETQKWQQDTTLLVKPVETAELTSTLRRLATNKAAGPDELTGETYKYLPPNSSAFEQLKQIINTALTTSKIPEQWRKAQVFLVFKSGDETQVSNYRPITLSNVSYKILMSIITRRLNNLFERNGVLTNSQGGFQPRRGCEQKTAQSTAIHQHAAQNHRELSTMYIDIAKAYDSVPHQAITDTLRAIKAPRSFIELISQIYRDNTIQILTPYGPTDPIPVRRGLRQGCPASCPLFNLFLDPVLHQINNTPTITGYTYLLAGKLEQIKALCYADDLKFVSNTMQDLQRMARMFANFAIYNGTKLSLEPANTKTKQKTVFSTSEKDWNTPENSTRTFEIKIYNPANKPHHTETKQVPRLGLKEPYKYLGILTTHDLTWDHQLQSLEVKANKLCSYHLQKIFTLSQAIRATNAILIPRLLYCLTSIPPSTQLDDTLRKINKNITSMIKRKLGLHHGPNTLQLPYRELGLCVPNINAMAAATQIQAIAKALNSNDPDTAKICIATYCKLGKDGIPKEIGETFRDDLIYDLGIQLQHSSSVRRTAGFVDQDRDLRVAHLLPRAHLERLFRAYPEFHETQLVGDLLQTCPLHNNGHYDELRPYHELRHKMDANTFQTLKELLCTTDNATHSLRVAAHILQELHPEVRRRIYSKTPLSSYEHCRSEGFFEVWTDASTKTETLASGLQLTTCAYAVISEAQPLNFSRSFNVVNHTNNTGELAAIVHAISACPYYPIRIYTDSLSQKFVVEEMISEVFSPYHANRVPRPRKNEPNESLLERRKLHETLVERKHTIAALVNSQNTSTTIHYGDSVDVEDITTSYIEIHHVFSHLIDNDNFDAEDPSTWSAEQTKRIETLKGNPHIGDKWYYHTKQNQKADRAAEAARSCMPQPNCLASYLDDEFLVCESLGNGKSRVIADPRREFQKRIATQLCQQYLQGVYNREHKKPHPDDRRVPLTLHPDWDSENLETTTIDRAMMTRCLQLWAGSYIHDSTLRTASKLWHDTMPSSAASAFRALESAINTGDQHAFYIFPLKYAVSPECPHQECDREESRWHAIQSQECQHEYLEIYERADKIRELVREALPHSLSHRALSLPTWWHQRHETPVVAADEQARPLIIQLTHFDKSLGSRAVIPAALRPSLRKLGVPGEKLNDLVFEITTVIVQGAQAIWRSRCSALQKRWTEHKSAERLKSNIPRNLWLVDPSSDSSDSETDEESNANNAITDMTQKEATRLIKAYYKRRNKQLRGVNRTDEGSGAAPRANQPSAFTFGTAELLARIRRNSLPIQLTRSNQHHPP